MLPTTIFQLNHLTEFYQFLASYNDPAAGKKVKDLINKIHEGDFIFTFCGHYSAGKSSLINELMGKSLLPSSPIPTTAHKIRVKHGADSVRVDFTEGSPLLFPNCTDLKLVDSQLNNKELINGVALNVSDIELSANIVFVDTPGIDSIDKAHMLAAESSIHLSDVLFYVVEYNHVQSEINIEFTKQLVDSGKSFVLIINQIDKHREEEISFEAFKQSVEHAFISSGAVPEKIFYTSIKDMDKNKNEISMLKQYIAEKIANKHSLAEASADQSFLKIKTDHSNTMTRRKKKNLEAASLPLAAISEEQIEKLELEMENLNLKLQRLVSRKEQQAEWEAEFLSIIKNAYIMPYANRELAESYLNSKDKKFKLGLFSSKQKIKNEQEKRLSEFHGVLVKTVQLQLLGPMTEFFSSIAGKVGGDAGAFKEQYMTESMFILEMTALQSLVNPNAQMSETYLLRYCEEVEDYIKSNVKKEAIKLFSILVSEQDELTKQEELALAEQQQNLETLLEAKQKIAEINTSWDTWKNRLTELMEERREDKEPHYLQLIEKPAEPIVQQINPVNAAQPTQRKRQAEVRPKTETVLTKPEEMIEQLAFVSEALTGLTGFKEVVRNLERRADTIRNKQYTICLFGAFSAGKSSFANALLGHPLLPVSPNPMTAAINRILPVDRNNQHGKMVVFWKSESEILGELQDYLQVFHEKAESLQAALLAIGNIKKAKSPSSASHFRYLDAFSEGYKARKESLGTVTTEDMKKLEHYVSVEAVSCFIAKIDVYFDCSLTRKGIVLVDTPGGDSINTRHSELSFEYMKAADSILYLSYYNHAFAKADRSFLLQLGRMKDSFEKDKMFFIMNAIDLAKDQEELDLVFDYLYEQLEHYGIRNPRIFPVSSLFSGDEPYKGQMEHFKASLLQFIEDEWLPFMLKAAEADCLAGIHMLEDFILTSETEHEKQKEQMERWKREEQELRSLLVQQKHSYLNKKLKAEIDEQVHYLKQRIFLQFNDWLKEAFHPGLLKGESRKQEGEKALDDFLMQLSHEVEQELRAVNLRSENYFYAQRKELFEQSIKSIRQKNKEIILQLDDTKRLEDVLTHLAPFRTFDRALFKKALSYYKNPKAFFEKGDRKYLAEEIKTVIESEGYTFFETEKERLFNYFNDCLEEEKQAMVQTLHRQMEEYYSGKAELFQNEATRINMKNALQAIKDRNVLTYANSR
ncbi:MULTISPECIES: dynamin family protein [unclassified Niallia]|uniref:dynamin family protein n=1 Tax=unclassified Niallia TaxID=2837522 RepID=UPI001EDC34A6|nr:MULTISPECIES: dynamin family protein [unclassified Niallia]MDL0435804.1 dynamin family protein [Niallia sp. SS-2023]UPO86371.1 dynamin family protein [Niallia sp. Man26]